MRWFELESTFQDDDRISTVIRRFGNRGLGALTRIWAHVAHKGSRPGAGVDSSGRPFDLENVAKRAGESVAYVRRLLDECAEVGHIDPKFWRDKGVIYLPALAKRAKRFHEKKGSNERVQALRDRVFARVLERCNGRCVHCSSVERLELERIIPKEAGGTNDEANLQIACVPCGRKRRAERAGRAGESAGGNAERNAGRSGDREKAAVKRQDVTAGRNAEPMSCSVEDRSNRSDLSDRSHTQGSEPAAAPLPLVGEVPRPRVNPHLAPVLAGMLPRDHLKCHAPCGRVCFPITLWHQLRRQIGGDDQAAERRLEDFKKAVLASIPEDQAIGDDPFKFWRAHFADRFPSAAPKQGKAGGPAPATAGRTGAAPGGKYDRTIRRDTEDQDDEHTNGGRRGAV